MRGDQHVTLTLLSAVLILMPWAATVELFHLALLFVGIFIGSIAPDADTADAVIMRGFSGGHGMVRRMKRHTVLALPIIGYTIRYLIYMPVSAIMWIITLGRVKPHHRGFLHSFPGAVLTSLLLTGYIWLVLLWLGINCAADLLFFGAGFFGGYILHLLEDSCTKSGVLWGYPFSNKKICGTIVTGNKREYRPGLFIAVLGMLVFIFLAIDLLFGIQDERTKLGAIIGFIAVWTLFFRLSGVHRG